MVASKKCTRRDKAKLKSCSVRFSTVNCVQCPLLDNRNCLLDKGASLHTHWPAQKPDVWQEDGRDEATPGGIWNFHHRITELSCALDYFCFLSFFFKRILSHNQSHTSCTNTTYQQVTWFQTYWFYTFIPSVYGSCILGFFSAVRRQYRILFRTSRASRPLNVTHIFLLPLPVYTFVYWTRTQEMKMFNASLMHTKLAATQQMWFDFLSNAPQNK